MTSPQLSSISVPLGPCRAARDENNYPWDASPGLLVANRTARSATSPHALAVISPCLGPRETPILLPYDSRGITERRERETGVEAGEEDPLYSQFVPLEAQAGGRKHAVGASY